jgi:hypothetical protein
MLDASNAERARTAFSLRLPPDLSKALRQAAQENERSQGAEIRHILRVHLERDAEAKP